MRILAAIFLLIAAAGAQAATEPDELVTASNAILCLEPGSLTKASRADIAKSQDRLRSLSCIRIGSGIPLTVLERSTAGAWKIRFRPEGIPGGVTLWGLASSFTEPDGEPVNRSQRAAR